MIALVITGVDKLELQDDCMSGVRFGRGFLFGLLFSIPFWFGIAFAIRTLCNL